MTNYEVTLINGDGTGPELADVARPRSSLDLPRALPHFAPSPARDGSSIIEAWIR
jgi:hypothetical protein